MATNMCATVFCWHLHNANSFLCIGLIFTLSLCFSRLLFTGEYLDILAISCDSFDEATNIDIGRHQKNTHHLASLVRIREWCKTYKVAFKINTVVYTHNLEEDMTQEILELNPVRWKVCSSYIISMFTLTDTQPWQAMWSWRNHLHSSIDQHLLKSGIHKLLCND